MVRAVKNWTDRRSVAVPEQRGGFRPAAFVAVGHRNCSSHSAGLSSPFEHWEGIGRILAKRVAAVGTWARPVKWCEDNRLHDTEVPDPQACHSVRNRWKQNNLRDP